MVRRGGYDIIATDSFLTRFSPEECEHVVDTWNALLAPGGVVVTTVRLRPYDQPYDEVSDEVSDFAARARKAAQRWRPYLRAGVDEITADARQYARRISCSDLGGEESVTMLFKRHGFDINYSEPATCRGETCNTQYLRIVATKTSTGGSDSGR
jgi:hypothetical protein